MQDADIKNALTAFTSLTGGLAFVALMTKWGLLGVVIAVPVCIGIGFIGGILQNDTLVIIKRRRRARRLENENG